MKIILTKQCLSLTGMLGSGYGYHIQQRKNGFFAKRNSNGYVPNDGHWRFIKICAELAHDKLHIEDIRVSGYELQAALLEAYFFWSANKVDLDNEYDAQDIIQFKNDCGI